MTKRIFPASFFLCLVWIVLSIGCAQLLPPGSTTQNNMPPGVEKKKAPSHAVTEVAPPQEAQPTGMDIQRILESENHRGMCYNLQPATVKTKKGHQIHGRCQPQSLIYARCRTGIMTCRLGDTSPVQWFSCARKNGNTTMHPTAGSVLVLDMNIRRGMPTGHPAYVEQATPNEKGTWRLRLSHTNYDRKCHLDQDTIVIYDPQQMTATFLSGPWKTWARNLKVLGFILR